MPGGGGRDVERRHRSCIEEVEALNPTPQPLACPKLLSGCWRLVYTTSDSILGTARQRPFKPDYTRSCSPLTPKLAAKNEEWVLGSLLKNQVRAELTPRRMAKPSTCSSSVSASVASVPTPASHAACWERPRRFLRISRGDKGNSLPSPRRCVARVIFMLTTSSRVHRLIHTPKTRIYLTAGKLYSCSRY